MAEKKLRIMILSDSFPPLHGGGAAIIAYRSALAMKKLGHDVFIFTTCRQEKDAGARIVDGLTVFFVQVDYNPILIGFKAIKNSPVLKILKSKIEEQ